MPPPSKPPIKCLVKKLDFFSNKTKSHQCSPSQRPTKATDVPPGPNILASQDSETPLATLQASSERNQDLPAFPPTSNTNVAAFQVTEQIAIQRLPLATRDLDAAPNSDDELAGKYPQHAITTGQITAATSRRQNTGQDARITCWDKALQALRGSNKEAYDDMQAIADYKMASPDDVARSAEERVRQLEDLQPSDAEIQYHFASRRLLKTISRGMSSMKDVVMPLARLDPHGAAPAALAIAFGGLYSLLQVVTNENAEYLFCLRSIVELRPMIARWAHYEGRFMAFKKPSLLRDHNSLEEALIDLYQAILAFLAVLTRYSAGSLIRRFAKTIAPSIQDWTQQLELIKSKDNNCKAYKEMLTGEITFQEETAKILKWLFAKDPQVPHKIVLEKTKIHDRYPEAGQWVFETNEYRNWSELPRPDGDLQACDPCVCLWLDGNIGTGKTTVMARIIQSAKEYPVPDTSIAFYYFSRNDSDATSVTSIACLQSLIRQLSWDSKAGGLSEHVRALYDKLRIDRPDSSTLAKQECLDILVRLIQGRRCSIFIDALDECGQSKDLVVTLNYIHNQANKTSKTFLRILISSRPNIDVKRDFDIMQGSTDATVRLSVSDHQPECDMEAFVNTELEKKREEPGPRTLFTAQSLLERLIRILLGKAGSMFRWVELQIELFTHESLQSRESIRQKLDRLENDATYSGLSNLEQLTEAYTEAYDIAKDDTSQWRATLVYKLLLCAFEDLSMTSLVEAIRSMTKAEDKDEINAQYIYNICSCFLTGNETVRFAHASAREFLAKLEDGDRSLVYATEKQHETAAILCLFTFKQNEQRLARLASSISDQRSVAVVPVDDFFDYSSFYWPFHCREVPSSRRTLPYTQGFESLLKYIADFIMSSSFLGWQHDIGILSSRGSFANWAQGRLKRATRTPTGYIPNPEASWSSPGHIITGFNFYELVDESNALQFDQRLLNIEDDNRRADNLLLLACDFGSCEILQRLQIYLTPDGLKQRIRDHDGGSLKTAHLLRAIKSRNVGAVSFLLQNGADIFEYVSRGGFGTLHRAVALKSTEILELLLQHTQRNLGEEKLQELLLRTDSQGRRALHWAIGRKYAPLIEVLLKHASSTDILDQILYGTPAEHCTALNVYVLGRYSQHSNGASEILKILLKYANQLSNEAWQEFLGALTEDGCNVLHHMIIFSQIQDVGQLLEHVMRRSSPSLQNLLQSRTTIDGNTPLHLAAGQPVCLANTLMEYAKYCPSPDFPTQYLEMRNLEGYTARDVAIAQSRVDQVAILDRVRANIRGRDANPRGSAFDITFADESETSAKRNGKYDEWYQCWQREQSQRKDPEYISQKREEAPRALFIPRTASVNDPHIRGKIEKMVASIANSRVNLEKNEVNEGEGKSNVRLRCGRKIFEPDGTVRVVEWDYVTDRACI